MPNENFQHQKLAIYSRPSKSQMVDESRMQYEDMDLLSPVHPEPSTQLPDNGNNKN